MIIRGNEIADLETPTGTMRAHIFRQITAMPLLLKVATKKEVCVE